MWLEVPGFKDLIHKWWNNYGFEGTVGFTLAQKLKALNEAIKVWNREVLGRVETRKFECLSKIEPIDMQEQTFDTSEEQRSERENLKKANHSWLCMEEISWKQKTRIDYLKYGDNNTLFFHCVANLRKEKNMVMGLRDNNQWVSGHAAVVEVIYRFYKDLFVEPFASRPKIEGLDFNILSDQWSQWLERPFSKLEVKEVLKGLKDDKAPGLDGFPMCFYTKFWSSIGEDVMNALYEFHLKGSLCRCF